jgi:hypothetical protein
MAALVSRGDNKISEDATRDASMLASVAVVAISLATDAVIIVLGLASVAVFAMTGLVRCGVAAPRYREAMHDERASPAHAATDCCSAPWEPSTSTRVDGVMARFWCGPSQRVATSSRSACHSRPTLASVDELRETI